MDAAFQHLKAWICQTLLNTTLTYSDCSNLVIVQTDTSKYGLGTALLQSSWPIAFTSKTLIDVETHYKNTESVSVSELWPQEVPHIPIQQACHCTK